MGRAKPWSLEEEGESQMQVFLTGSSGRTETARVSFPHATRGGGAEKRHPRKFSPSQDEEQDEHHQQDGEEDDNRTPLPSVWKKKEESVPLR